MGKLNPIPVRNTSETALSEALTSLPQIRSTRLLCQKQKRAFRATEGKFCLSYVFGTMGAIISKSHGLEEIITTASPPLGMA
jgi:hypothetical protein